MATSAKTENNAYDKIEDIVMNRVLTLEDENTQLKNELLVAKAKLEVYERLANITGAKTQLGFNPPLDRE